MPPFLGQMWVCPNRKMNRYVEHAPSGKEMKERSSVKKNCMVAMVAHDLEWKCSENWKNGTKHTHTQKSSFWRSTIFDHLLSCALVII